MRLLLSLYPVAILGISDTLVFSVDYFQTRRVPYICLVSCGVNDLWSKEFTKLASNHSVAVSSITPDEGWVHKMEACIVNRNFPVGIVVNAACEVRAVEDLLITASENMWFDAMHMWLFLDDIYKNKHNNKPDSYNDTYSKGNRVGILEILSQMNISVDTDIKLATAKGSLKFTIADIFNFGKVQGGSLKVTDMGSWSPSGFSTNLNLYKYYRRWNFEQWSLRVVSVATVPENSFDPALLSSNVPVPGVSTITRTTTIILNEMAEVHNIKFVHSITDRWIGSFERNNTKIAGNALYYRTQDLTSVLRISKNLTFKFGFLYPALTSLETRYYYRIPTTGPGKFENQFFRPFSAGVWSCTFGMCLVCGAILLAAALLERRPSAAQFALFSVIANVCQQYFEDDSLTKRSSAARKLTIFITGMSCVLIYNYYTSSVVSWLLNGPPPSINSLQELLDSPLELVYQDVGYTRSWLSNPVYYYNKRNTEIEDKIRRKIHKKKEDSILKPLDEGIALVKAGGYAYHTETDEANRRISRTFTLSELCELGSLKSLERTLLYPGVQKDSPYKEFLTWSLMRLLERGIVSNVQKRTVARPVACQGSSPRALALGGAAPAFIMLALGFFTSTLIMLLERAIHKCVSNPTAKKRYAYHTETDEANRRISRTFTLSELCELGSLKSLERTLLYPGVQKDSPYKEFLTWSLMRLLERGIVSNVQKRTVARPVACQGSSPRALALGGAAPAFIMLALGFFTSTLIMLLERAIHKCVSNPTAKKRRSVKVSSNI